MHVLKKTASSTLLSSLSWKRLAYSLWLPAYIMLFYIWSRYLNRLGWNKKQPSKGQNGTRFLITSLPLLVYFCDTLINFSVQFNYSRSLSIAWNRRLSHKALWVKAGRLKQPPSLPTAQHVTKGWPFSNHLLWKRF